VTEEEDERAAEVAMAISKKVTILVAHLIETHKLTPEQDDQVRTLLTENYRFWAVP
jgi:hypothetical protein